MGRMLKYTKYNESPNKLTTIVKDDIKCSFIHSSLNTDSTPSLLNRRFQSWLNFSSFKGVHC